MTDVPVDENAAPNADAFLERLEARFERFERDGVVPGQFYKLFQELDLARDDDERSKIEQRLRDLRQAHSNHA
jgi:hypothetical protein